MSKAASVVLALSVLALLVVQACRSTPNATKPADPAAASASVDPAYLPASKAGPIVPVQQASGTPK